MIDGGKVKETFGSLGLVGNCYFKHADCCGKCGGKRKVCGIEGIIDERFGDDYEDMLNASIDAKKEVGEKSLDGNELKLAIDEELEFEWQLQNLLPQEEIEDSNEESMVAYMGPQKGGRKFIKHMESHRVRQSFRSIF